MTHSGRQPDRTDRWLQVANAAIAAGIVAVLFGMFAAVVYVLWVSVVASLR